MPVDGLAAWWRQISRSKNWTRSHRRQRTAVISITAHHTLAALSVVLAVISGTTSYRAACRRKLPRDVIRNAYRTAVCRPATGNVIGSVRVLIPPLTIHCVASIGVDLPEQPGQSSVDPNKIWGQL